ncbi:MAG: class II aldolase/adducin family protein [Thermoanaerobaculaceae bacterium]
MATWTEALRRAEMVAVGAALTRRGLVRGREGNLSCRLADGDVLLTPAGADKGRMLAENLRRCSPHNPPEAGVSSEARMHFAIYRRCPQVLSVVHAHPVAVLSLAALGRSPDPRMLREGAALVSRIEVVQSLQPGSRELAEECARALERAPVAILLEHGVVCGGDDLWQALGRVEILELLAGIELGRSGSVVPI